MFRVGIHAKFGEDSAEIVVEGATLTWDKLHRLLGGGIEPGRGCAVAGWGLLPMRVEAKADCTKKPAQRTVPAGEAMQ